MMIQLITTYREDHRTEIILCFELLYKTINNRHCFFKEFANIQTDEIGTLKKTLDSLRKENETLQSCVSDYVERERLLVSYPDLNIRDKTSPMVQGKIL